MLVYSRICCADQLKNKLMHKLANLDINPASNLWPDSFNRSLYTEHNGGVFIAITGILTEGIIIFIHNNNIWYIITEMKIRENQKQIGSEYQR